MSVTWKTRQAAESVTLQASAVQTVSGTASGVAFPQKVDCITWEFDLTTAATAASDTLDVTIQTMIDTTNWVDIVHFTQALGTGGTKRYFAKTIAALTEAMFENGSSLSAGSVRNLFGDQYRAKWTIVNGSNASFTFAVYGCPQ